MLKAFYDSDLLLMFFKRLKTAAHELGRFVLDFLDRLFPKTLTIKLMLFFMLAPVAPPLGLLDHK